VGGEGSELTFPAAVPERRIDYLYLTGGTSCQSARVLPSDASDHRPVLVWLRLR
jgi:endonuclease/exonuclease/phosphatase (EEP) superfamily protein YafD